MRNDDASRSGVSKGREVQIELGSESFESLLPCLRVHVYKLLCTRLLQVIREIIGVHFGTLKNKSVSALVHGGAYNVL